MIKLKSQGYLLAFLLGMTVFAPAHSQQAPVKTSQSQATADDTDIDLANPPLYVQYAHGESTENREHYLIPVPRDPAARKRYQQAQGLLNIGTAYLEYSRYDKAIARLNQSLALWPDNAQTYRWLAEAYEANGNTQQAIANYRLLFYGWPGRVRSGQPERGDDQVPADKPRDYDQTTPAETDPTLLMKFSLLLQQTNQYAEAKRAYERGMQALVAKFPADRYPEGVPPLPPPSAEALNPPLDLEAATRTALAIDQATYADTRDAEDNLNRALQLCPNLSAARFHLAKLKTGG